MVATCDAFGCTYSCKYPRVEFFIGSLLQIPKANDFDRDGCRTFILQFHCRKMKTFLFARIISEKTSSSETLGWGILYLFPCSGNPYTILKPLHRQSFLDLLQSLNTQSLLCNFYISALAFSLLLKSSINYLFYWS